MTKPETQSVPAKTRPGIGCLVRGLWMFAGNLLLLFFAFAIAGGRGLSFSAFDIAFWAVVPALLLVRYLDIRLLRGDTVTGERATLGHFARYAWLLPVVALVLWAAAHAWAWSR